MSNSNILKIGSLLNKFPNNGSKIELSQELKDALVGVWLAYGKSNDSTDRNIIKNKIKDKGGDFVISNAAFKLNSGFGKYDVDFTSWIQTNGVIASSDKVQNSITGRFLYFNTVNKKEDIPSFKVNITLGQQSKLQYNYIKEDGTSTYIVYSGSGIYTIPASYFSKYTGGNAWFGFYQIEGTSIIEQIPSFEGAFVTDGIDDLITSTKTVQEMLGGSNEITVVSMMANLDSRQILCNSNFSNVNGYNVRNTLEPNGVISMLGYTDKNGTTNNLNLIMGDKDSIKLTDKVNFNSDYVFYPAQYYKAYYQVAWYWTFIANRVLTTDEINQVIAYYNLDRTLRPDILCNITKQGITNDNHADFNDKLIDYSGNGRDIQMNNLAWKGGSGIAAKPYETFKDWLSESSSTSIITQIDEFTRIVESTTNGYWVSRIRRDSDLDKVYDPITTYLYQDNNSLIHECKYKVDGVDYTIPIYERVEKGFHQLEIYSKDRYTKLPENAENIVLSEWYYPRSTKGSIKYSVIPSYKGGILLDGINDFGKVTGMPIYKDYTVIADYERFYLEPITGGRASILSKSSKVGDGSFIFNLEDQNGGKACYTFGEANGNISDDITRIIRYQSKYYNTKALSIGTAEDNDFMVLGKVREVDNRYFYGAIYSLMSFPYSMSEFLIERQLKKYKLGTLYPDMVEFRPVIKSNVLLDAKPTFVIRGTSTYLNAGDYVPENSQIWVSIKMNNIADRITKFTVNGKTIDIPENAYSEVTLQYGFPFVIDKSPQKIGITIEQDENYVLFNPVINSNYDNYKLTFHLREYEKLINIGDYIPKGTYIRANLYLKNNIDELVTFTFNGVNIDYVKSSVSDLAYNIRQIYNYDSPQEVNITIDEYIRYEDIVQPYPVVFQIKDRNTNQIYGWGDKIKVGSSIQLSQGENPNLLNGLYSIRSYEYEGKTYSYNQLTNLNITLTKQSISLSCNKIWLLDNNEPKCILSPRLLRIPNSSYKILGHIPDISGHGNHGKINNSAYAGMSGANGYPYDYKNGFMAYSNCRLVDSETFNVISISPTINIIKNTPIYKGKIKVTGLSGYLKLRIYPKDDYTNVIEILKDGVYDINIDNETDNVYFHVAKTKEGSNDINVIIQQVGEYEGAFYLDGVDDHITIPTLSSGGKQVLMKVNSRKSDCYLYDQRNNWTQYLGIVSTKDFIAYNYSNQRGKTYIDGILNENITANDLIGITHNITVTNNRDDVKQYSPCIGTSFARNSYAQMALYDFMLFDNISTDDKIKELNEIIGIEDNIVEWNPTITSNISSAYNFVPRIRKSDGTIIDLKIGNIYLASTTGNLVSDIVPPNKNLDEVSNVVIDGKSYTPIKYPNYYRVEIPLVFPNEINVTIDEYITYETIEQPYPIFLNYIDKETNKAYTWGDKVKVDSILKISGYKNLFENGDTSLGGSNGYSVNGSSELIALGTLLTSEILVNKINTGVRSSVIWNLNTPKPLFAYDPSIINNVGLKNLGYLPDITGQGRHLLLNEFAYEGMSGINGYPVVLGVNKTWETVSGTANYTSYITSNNIHVTHVKRANNGLLYSYVKLNGELTNIKEIPSFKVNIKGLEGNSRVRYYYLATENATSNSVLNLKNGINEISKSFIPTDTLLNNSNNVWIGFSISAISDEVNSFDCDITIEILPNYEGSLYFDGVNDYGTVQNLTYGGKCLISKVNYNLKSSIIYDQCSTLNNNPETNTFALVINTTNDNAYSTRLTGDVYINNVLNNYIGNTDLNNNTHVVTATCSIVDSSNSEVPIFGRSKTGSNHAQFAMYKTILLSEIPTTSDRETINNWCGLPTGYLPKPEYYWDAYGKSNLDEDKSIIQQRGIAKGYNLGSFTTTWYYKNDSSSVGIVSKNPYSITLKRLEGTNDFEFRNAELKVITKPVTVSFRANKDIGFIYDYHYRRVGESGEGPVLSKGVKMTANEEFVFSINPVSQEDIDRYNIDVSTGYYMLYFKLNTFAVDEEVTIEMLPVEGGKSLALTNNNFAYDKMSGYGGYEFAKFNTDEWTKRNRENGIEIIERNAYSFTAKRIGTGEYYWDFNNASIKQLNRNITVRAVSNKSTKIRWEFKYRTAEKPDIDTTIILVMQAMTPNVPITITLPYKTEEEIANLGVTEGSAYYFFYFEPASIPIGEEYTVEMLPLYPNGLVYNGVYDNSENVNIPAFTDYTYIFKRTLLNKKYNSASIFKGSNKQSGGGAFICDYNSVAPDLLIQGYSFGAGLYVNSLNTNEIVYGTKDSINGQVITPGNNTDAEGLTIGKWRDYRWMVFYKLMLWSKSINNIYHINMLRNLIYNGGIIDLNNPIFESLTDKN